MFNSLFSRFKSASRRRLIDPVTVMICSIRGVCKLTESIAIPAFHIKRGEFKTSLNAALIITFALLHAADGIITYLGLKFTSVDEANPVLVLVAGAIGLGLSIFLLKLACLSVLAFLYSARRNLGNCWSTASLISADAFYSWVVGNNLFLVSVA